MLKITTIAFAVLIAVPAFATSQDCKPKGGGYMCPVVGYIDGSKASSVAEANALAVAAQSQDQSQSQSSTNTNVNQNSITTKSTSIGMAAPAGGGCDMGMNVFVGGQGGGVCWNSNQKADALEKLGRLALDAGSSCVALKIATSHRSTKHIKVQC